MENRVFERKIYSKMLEWKNESNEKTALLIKGARRVGKSTIAEEFAKKKYDSYIFIDFSIASKETHDLFRDLSGKRRKTPLLLNWYLSSRHENI